MENDVSGVGESTGGDESPTESAAPQSPVQDYKSTKHKVKIDGSEQDVDYEELLAGYQTRASSSKKFEEANRLQKQLQEFVASAKQDPRRFFEAIGMDPLEWAKQQTIERLKYESLSDEERERLELKQEKERLQKELETERKTKTERERQALEEQAESEIASDIQGALQKAGVKPTARAIARMAEVMMRHLDKDTGDLKVKASDALKRFKSEISDDVTDYLSNLEGESLLKALPESVLKKINQALLSKNQTPLQQRTMQAATGKQQPSQSKGSPKAQNIDELFNSIGSKFK